MRYSGVPTLGVLLFVALAPLGCRSPEPAPVDYGAGEPVSSSELPSLEEQAIMDRRIKYCQDKFGMTRIESRNACITGYLAQPIPNSTDETMAR